MDLGNMRRRMVVADADGGHVDRNLGGCRDIDPATDGRDHRRTREANSGTDGDKDRPATLVVEARDLADAEHAGLEQP